MAQSRSVLEATIANAERDLQTERIETAKQQLTVVRTEGRKAKVELEALTREIRDLDSTVVLEQANLAATADAIHAHIASKPSPEDFPTDAELLKWRTEYDQLVELRNVQSQKIIDLARQRAAPLQAAVNLNAHLGQLQWQRRNFEALLRGETLGEPRGEIRHV